MQALWITLGAIAGLLLLVVLLLLVGKARIRIVCVQKPKVIASVLGIRFTLISDEKKEKDATRDLSRCRNPRRALKKEWRRQRKAAKKALKKKEKAQKKALQKKKQKKAAANQPTPNVIENLTMITNLIKRLYELTKGKVRIRVKAMHLMIATGDAAKTAFTYGLAVQMTAGLMQFIQEHFAEIERKPGAMSVRADYLAQASHVDIDVSFSMRLTTALRIGLQMLSAYQAEKAEAKKKAKQRREQANDNDDDDDAA